MGLENFRPHWKPVEDKSLAHDMAKASDSYRTEAERQKRIAQNYSKKRTVMDRILGISQEYQNEVAKRHTEDAGEESKTADFNEDMVEIENFAREEAKGLTAEQLEALIKEAKKDVESVIAEMDKPKKALDTEGPTAEYIKKNTKPFQQEHALKRKYILLNARLKILQDIYQHEEGKDK